MPELNFWNNDSEIQFFTNALQSFSAPEQLFYNLADGLFAYVPKGSDAEGQTLQSRNSLIGHFTEKWCRDFLTPLATEMGLFAVNGVECEELGLTKQSRADLAFCTTESNTQIASNIKIIFEIKMSVISNYKCDRQTKVVSFLGDYKSHQGNPALLRSDSMLKAIGKSINIRVSGLSSTKIPIVVLGNSPITVSYSHKVDYLKKAGVIQGFLSLNPRPKEGTDFIVRTPSLGFQTISDITALKTILRQLVTTDMNYFSSMLPKNELGYIISIAAQENTDIAKAEKFLQLIRA
ncbi:MAG: hypothetical protein Q7W05_01175 [Deltaproteobacteria bacterium]|nr:hypothetical protein [Deltaproteobacteria bacterium]